MSITYVLVLVAVCLLTYLFLELVLGPHLKLKRQKMIHEVEVKLLKAEHQSALNGKNLKILDEKIEALEANVVALDLRMQRLFTYKVLNDFKTWWKTIGQYEYEIVRRQNPKQEVILRLENQK